MHMRRYLLLSDARGLALMTCLFVMAGHTSGSTEAKKRSCTVPDILDCSVTTLTAPLHGDFTVYGIVESSLDTGPILSEPTWTKSIGNLSKRASVSRSGTEYVQNITLFFKSIEKSDGGDYKLEAVNECGSRTITVKILLNKGGCHNYEAPNATHIGVLSTALEGHSFSLYCDYNGDTFDLHYLAIWNKGTLRDVVLHGKHKYKSYRGTTCPDGDNCCSFTDILVVKNATQNDSDVYTCIAWSVDGGAPMGTSLSIYVVVIPEPEITSHPKDISADEGQEITLSCAVKGFQNSTLVQWKIDDSLIDTTHTQFYHLTRTALTDMTFTETLRFSVSPQQEGRYSCCVGYQAESLVNLLTVGEVAGESKCGEEAAKVSIAHIEEVSVRKWNVYILYKLELGIVSKPSNPTYEQVVELASKLESENISCYYHVIDRMNSTLSEVTPEDAIDKAKVVLVIISEVLHSAITTEHFAIGSDVNLQMKESSFPLQTIQHYITHNPQKFIPVQLAGSSRVIGKLENCRVYNLKEMNAPSGDYESLLEEIRKRTF